MLAFSDGFQKFLGFSNPSILPIIGGSLIVFSWFVYSVASRHLDNKKLINLITLLDAFWVIGSSIILALGLFNLTHHGYIAIGVVALWIGYLGYSQYKHNKPEE